MKKMNMGKILLLSIVLCLDASFPSRAGQNVDALFTQAITMQKNLESGDTSGVERLLEAILEQDSTHPKALWQLTFRRYRLFDDEGESLSQQAAKLAAAAPLIQTIVAEAQKRGDPAFAHYVLGRYAGLHNAFDRALAEMDKALAAEPDSVRYRVIKGTILIDKGQWEKNDASILQGMQLIDEARRMAETAPGLYYKTADFYFKLAFANASLASQNLQKTIDYYHSFLQHALNKTNIAFAWNNLSIAHRRLGECEQARNAADNALQIADFGAARSNRRYARFCQEMKAMGFSMPMASRGGPGDRS